MRASVALSHSSLAPETAAAAAKGTFSQPPTIQHSQWQYTVPYLYGALAVTLCLTIYAFFLLVFSNYWNSGQVNGGENGGDRDLAGGSADEGDGSSDNKALPMEEKYLVIMAGDVNPTFLATPTSTRASL